MTGGSSMLNRRGFYNVAAIGLILLVLFYFKDDWLPGRYQDNLLDHGDLPHGERPTQQTNAPEPSTPDNESLTQPAISSCNEMPGADRVMVILKTGATELYQKLPTHFLTTFSCAPNFMIFSDLEQSFADYTVHDAVASVGQHYRDHHEDFELYRKLAEYQREGQDMSTLKGDGGWNLDKWKFLPMLHKAFESANANIDWFIIIEADTSMSWTNLLQWLGTMDPKKPLYMGAQNVIGETTFAHGGSGVLISRRAADLLEEVRTKQGKTMYDERWEELTSVSCCGDEVIARAFLEADVPLTPSWPLIQGETVSSVDWTQNHWCTPPVTWHHVSPIEIDTLWQFGARWVEDHGWNEPYLFRDVFAHYIERHISVNRTKWNNLSKDRKIVSASLATGDDEDFYGLSPLDQTAIESAGACADACERQRDWDCVQWMFMPGRCHLGRDIRFGKSDEHESDHWISGWHAARIDRFKKSFNGCRNVRWHG